MDLETQQALQKAAALAGATTTSPTPSSQGPRFELDPRWAEAHDTAPDVAVRDEPRLSYAPEFPTAASSTNPGDGLRPPLEPHHPPAPALQSVDVSAGAAELADSSHPDNPNPQKYTSMGQPSALSSVSPPENIIEWRKKFFNISQTPLVLPKQQWDDLWIWIDNIWTPRRVPYTKKDGTIHYEWRCRYHKKVPLPSQSTGKRKREIRKGYGCLARMTANLVPSTHVFTVEGFETHNHGLEELDSTKICSGVRKWTSMHVQMGLQPKQIEAIIGGKDAADRTGTREALDTAGGKLLDEKTIRNIARRWRWPAAKFNMRQDDLFRELHSQHNTFPFAVQEPEAFHRDVCDISGVAQTADDLHRLLDERKEVRLRELDQRFDAAASSITRDPSQTGQQHWDNVLQLFRDRSYDALVRYFSAFANPEEAAPEAQQPPVLDAS